MPGDPSHADLASGKILISIDDPFGNHNGGMIDFGRDGFLYIGTGDGGGANDQLMNGQNKDALLGKMLRIDVDHPAGGKPYGIPKSNPFASGGGAPEIYMLGLRNPWRWSFDQITGDQWIGDVGQDQIEEVDFVANGKGAGVNLGWNTYEADTCFHEPCDPAGMTMPVWQETHANGWISVIGGQVYRGGCAPDLVGKYLYTDYGKHELRAGTLGGDGKLVSEVLTVKGVEIDGTMFDGFPGVPSSLHADARGELYLTTSGASPDAIWHLEVSP
jgi:glucose/arabinose dehydrogenase